MSNQNTKKVTSVVNMGTLMQAIFADYAAVIRVAQAGLDWTPIGSITSAVQCGRNTPVMIYNSTGTTLYIVFGSQSVAAPTGPANGVPVLSGQIFVANSGLSSWVIGSAAGLYAYNADTT